MAQYSAQILKTIGDQIENLAPLRESFRHLQQYYQKLTKDFDQLLDYSVQSKLFRNIRKIK